MLDYDEEGYVYYWNRVTQKSQWESPWANVRHLPLSRGMCFIMPTSRFLRIVAGHGKIESAE